MAKPKRPCGRTAAVLATGLRLEKLRQATQIDHGRGEREQQLDLLEAAQLHLPQRAVLLGVAEHGLDELAGDLAQRVARVARGACIDPAGTPRGVPRCKASSSITRRGEPQYAQAALACAGERPLPGPAWTRSRRMVRALLKLGLRAADGTLTPISRETALAPIAMLAPPGRRAAAALACLPS